MHNQAGREGLERRDPVVSTEIEDVARTISSARAEDRGTRSQ